MALVAAGPLVVPTPGTLVPVSSLVRLQENNLPIIRCHGVLFQALVDPPNVGTTSIYQLAPDGQYYLLAVLGVPTTSFIPSFSASLTWSPNAVALTDLYLDAQNAGEGALVTVLIS